MKEMGADLRETVCSTVWGWDKYLAGALQTGDLIHMLDTCHCPHVSKEKMVSIRTEEDERSL